MIDQSQWVVHHFSTILWHNIIIWPSSAALGSSSDASALWLTSLCLSVLQLPSGWFGSDGMGFIAPLYLWASGTQPPGAGLKKITRWSDPVSWSWCFGLCQSHSGFHACPHIQHSDFQNLVLTNCPIYPKPWHVSFVQYEIISFILWSRATKPILSDPNQTIHQDKFLVHLKHTGFVSKGDSESNWVVIMF